ncbi:hypothetical protein AFLA_000467 [Aspergillus flavus NRRL3357]|nr:hypothetical protein AFLA_000467 [Aspergillus flavus NRRL3357]
MAVSFSAKAQKKLTPNVVLLVYFKERKRIKSPKWRLLYFRASYRFRERSFGSPNSTRATSLQKASTRPSRRLRTTVGVDVGFFVRSRWPLPSLHSLFSFSLFCWYPVRSVVFPRTCGCRVIYRYNGLSLLFRYTILSFSIFMYRRCARFFTPRPLD